MSLNSTLEEQIKKQEKRVQEIVIRMENLDRELDELFVDLKVTPEQLDTFISDKNNFTDENWEQLQNLRKVLEEKLQRELDNIRDPLKIKQTYSDRNVGRHWIFVR